MQYLGGKSRLAKKIVAIIQQLAPETVCVCEPFMGGGAVTQQLAAWRDTVAGDVFPGLAELYRAVQTGWRLPAEGVSDDEYQTLKRLSKTSTGPLITAVGFGLSFGGKWFGGLARPAEKYAKHFNSWADRFSKTSAVFLQADYKEWRGLARPGTVFYADPPYRNTEGYSGTAVWDAARFDEEARVWRRAGARVFVSEFSAPFTPVAQFERVVAVDNATGAPRKTCTDILYEVEPTYPPPA